jgi:NhaP-type Na+/H+ or K+/H+ antiporter
MLTAIIISLLISATLFVWLALSIQNRVKRNSFIATFVVVILVLIVTPLWVTTYFTPIAMAGLVLLAVNLREHQTPISNQTPQQKVGVGYDPDKE